MLFFHFYKSNKSVHFFIYTSDTLFETVSLVYSVSITEWDSYCPGMQVEHPDTVLTFVMNDDFWFMHNSEYPQKKYFLGGIYMWK